MSPYVYTALVFLISGFSGGLAGFGAVLCAIPLLSLFLDIKAAIPLALLSATVAHLIVLYQLWPHFEWGRLYPLVAGAAPGALIGAYFLKRVDAPIVHAVLGLILVAFSMYSLVFRPPSREMKTAWSYAFGFCGGLLGAAFGATGPAVIIYTALMPWNKDLAKVTLQGFFIISGLLVVGLYLANGLVQMEVLKLFGVGLPALIFGTMAGSYVYRRRVGGESYRTLMLIFLGVLGAVMIYRS